MKCPGCNTELIEVEDPIWDNYCPNKDCHYERDEMRKFIANKWKEVEAKTSLNLNIYPLVIVADRYSGVYSGASYLAFKLFLEDLPVDIEAEDNICINFWKQDGYSKNYIIGKGSTPDDARRDLASKLAAQTKK